MRGRLVMRAPPGVPGRRSGCPFSGITLAISPVVVGGPASTRMTGRVIVCPPGANGPCARAPEPPTQRGAVIGEHIVLIHVPSTTPTALRASWIPAFAGMTAQGVRGASVESWLFNHAAGTRQAVPGRADLFFAGRGTGASAAERSQKRMRPCQAPPAAHPGTTTKQRHEQPPSWIAGQARNDTGDCGSGPQ